MVVPFLWEGKIVIVHVILPGGIGVFSAYVTSYFIYQNNNVAVPFWTILVFSVAVAVSLLMTYILGQQMERSGDVVRTDIQGLREELRSTREQLNESMRRNIELSAELKAAKKNE